VSFIEISNRIRIHCSIVTVHCLTSLIYHSIGDMDAPGGLECQQGYVLTSTTLYITCIAGCQYNFIHITRILFNFANDIAGYQYNFIHITRILFNFANDIAGCQYNFIHITRILFNFVMTSQGASIISFISLEFCLILLMTLGSQIRVPNRGPKSGSQMGVSKIEVQNQGQKSGSKIGVPNGGPKSGS
jgi:hypothetical protein